ncbi:MAG: 4-hydroxy-tetrahydrodipicolinate reductase [Bacteroidales bacterium]|nr:4-hydroxy-tetrahydrodipicolinate reductase [Bacteroidales bacterium]
MKIALLGYGKMGKAIEQLATERGHDITVTIDDEDDWMDKLDELRDCDMAIDFSTPATVVGNIMRCFDLDLPVVVGTTGWYDQLESVVHDCQQRGKALFVASNFSIGMNIMFELNRRLAQLMNSHEDYDVTISETHHIHKLDAPSGTAITLANDIIEELDRKDEWMLWKTVTEQSVTQKHRRIKKDTLPITSIREGEVPGIHEVVYDSDIDTITLRHSAKSRKGLAMGAILAAEYMEGKKGYYTMTDLLK